MSLQFAYYYYSTASNIASEKIRVENRGVNIDYQDSIKGDTALIFVHDWCLNKSYWSHQWQYFQSRYRVITFDLPGFGKSGKNRAEWTVEEHGRDISALVTQLNVKSVIIIGHSTSSAIAVESAIQNKRSLLGLITIETFTTSQTQAEPISSKTSAGDFGLASGPAKRLSRRKMMEYVNNLFFSKRTTPLIRKKVLDDMARTSARVALNCLEHIRKYPLSSKLKELDEKVYVINGEMSQTDLTQLYASNVPFEFTIVPKTGHFPMLEQPQALNHLLDHVLEQVILSKLSK